MCPRTLTAPAVGQQHRNTWPPHWLLAHTLRRTSTFREFGVPTIAIYGKKIILFSSCQGLLLECNLCSRTLIILVPENVIVLACENHVGPRFRRSLANVQPSKFRKNCNSTQLVEWIELVADLHGGQLSSDWRRCRSFTNLYILSLFLFFLLLRSLVFWGDNDDVDDDDDDDDKRRKKNTNGG